MLLYGNYEKYTYSLFSWCNGKYFETKNKVKGSPQPYNLKTKNNKYPDGTEMSMERIKLEHNNSRRESS